MKLEYGYGTNTQNNGSLRSQKISFNGLTQPFEQTYAYDDLNRLLSAEEKVNNATTWKQTFQYDRYGNRRFDAANTTTLTNSNNVTNPNIDTATNRFSANQGYTYDKDGNVTLDAENKRFVYDAENHQKEFFAPTNNTNTPDATYHYDGGGKRVKKISSTETTVFIYDGAGQLVAEYSTNVTPQAEAKISYLTSDHLGSPRVITDATGKVIARHDYSAFGDETFTIQRTDTLGYKPDTIRQDYTGYQNCIVHQIRNSLAFVGHKEKKAVAADLKPIYTAATVEEALFALEEFSEKWNSRYLLIAKSWRENWTRIEPMFAFTAEIRKAIYTTNAIESLNMSLRKIIKTRGSFPSEDACLKLLFLGLKNAAKKWTMPIQNWGLAMNQFAIMFEDRINLAELHQLTQNS